MIYFALLLTQQMTIDHSFGTDDRLINRGFGLYGKVTAILPDGRFQVIMPDIVAMSSMRKQYTLRRFPIGVQVTENRKVLRVAVSELKRYFLGKTIVVRCYKEYPNHMYLFLDDNNFVKNNVSNASDFCIESGFGIGIQPFTKIYVEGQALAKKQKRGMWNPRYK